MFCFVLTYPSLPCDRPRSPVGGAGGIRSPCKDEASRLGGVPSFSGCPAGPGGSPSLTAWFHPVPVLGFPVRATLRGRELPCPCVNRLAVETGCWPCTEKTRAPIAALLLCTAVLHPACGYPKFAEFPFLSSFDSIDGIRHPPQPCPLMWSGGSRGISGPSSQS